MTSVREQVSEDPSESATEHRQTLDGEAARWVSLGRMDYQAALSVQKSQARRLLHGSDTRQTVFSVEHPPTITIGRNGSNDHILAPPAFLQSEGFSVHEVDRGGDVTYHGPGQWVLYPVLHLAPWGNDVRRYVRMLEEIAIRALAGAGIVAGRVDGLPGAWIADRKICAVGARVERRMDGEFVTSHGMALNVTTNMRHFAAIVPCGLSHMGVTSVVETVGHEVDFAEWEGRLQRAFSDVFRIGVESESSTNDLMR